MLGWIDANGYDGANQAMRTHIFDPAGYPADVPVTIAWGSRTGWSARRSPSAARPEPASSSCPSVGHTPTWDDPELIARTLLDGSAPATCASSDQSGR